MSDPGRGFEPMSIIREISNALIESASFSYLGARSKILIGHLRIQLFVQKKCLSASCNTQNHCYHVGLFNSK